jgi:hypothetical protein
MGCHHLIKQMDARGGVKQNGNRFNQHMERVEHVGLMLPLGSLHNISLYLVSIILFTLLKA